jgi:hypothetical protein
MWPTSAAAVFSALLHAGDGVPTKLLQFVIALWYVEALIRP